MSKSEHSLEGILPTDMQLMYSTDPPNWAVRLQVFPSETNSLYTVLWFQVFLSNINLHTFYGFEYSYLILIICVHFMVSSNY